MIIHTEQYEISCVFVARMKKPSNISEVKTTYISNHCFWKNALLLTSFQIHVEESEVEKWLVYLVTDHRHWQLVITLTHQRVRAHFSACMCAHAEVCETGDQTLKAPTVLQGTTVHHL